jgi:hypothetical protein
LAGTGSRKGALEVTNALDVVLGDF